MSPSSEALPQTVKRNRTRSFFFIQDMDYTEQHRVFFFMLKTMPLAFSSSSVFVRVCPCPKFESFVKNLAYEDV
jgi:hypothetical protein